MLYTYSMIEVNNLFVLSKYIVLDRSALKKPYQKIPYQNPHKSKYIRLAEGLHSPI